MLYSLDGPCQVPWSASAESQLHQDYPFLSQEGTDEDFVIRRYLETLWLPESFNPLSHLIASLRRISVATGSNDSRPHPLHALLGPLLLPARAASDKYRTELVQILADGGGAGEQEEMMMWYAYEYEKADGVADEEKWRKEWLERLERRETMIQILLTMLKISLPGPSPPTQDAHPKKKKPRNKRTPPPETDEVRLESYMDKLAVWQLTASLSEPEPISSGVGSSQGGAKADRHWTQVFCEDVVESLFKTELPEKCALCRSKVFPTSPFSDVNDSDAESLMDGRATSRAGSRARSLSRRPTPLSRVPSVAPSNSGGASSLARSRGRSLSVTLAVDEASQRASFIEPKRVLCREVSMNRSFREKPKPKPRPKEEPKPVRPKLKRDMGTTLVAETPVKWKRADSDPQGASSQHSLFAAAVGIVPSPPPTSSSPGTTYVEDTPLLLRTAARSQLERHDTQSSLVGMPPLSPLSSTDKDAAVHSTPARPKARGGMRAGRAAAQLKNSNAIFEDEADERQDENLDDSFTGSFGSPDVLLFGEKEHYDAPPAGLSTLKAHDDIKGMGRSMRRISMLMDDAGEDFTMELETPTKKRVRRK